MPANFLSRSFQQACEISMLDKDWVSLKKKDTQCKLTKEALDKKWFNSFPMPIWYNKAEELAKEAMVKHNTLWIRKITNW